MTNKNNSAFDVATEEEIKCMEAYYACMGVAGGDSAAIKACEDARDVCLAGGSLNDATFVVQRGDTQFSCLGSELGAKLLDDDLLIAQREGNNGSIVKGSIQDTDLFLVIDGDNGHKSVTGAQVKGLFTPPGPWIEWLKGYTKDYYYLEVIVTEEDSCTVNNECEVIWNADTHQEVTLEPFFRKATKKPKKNIDPSKANPRLARHIRKYKQSEEFLALSEKEQKDSIYKFGGQAFYSYYYYGSYYTGGTLPIGRYIIGGSYEMSFEDSEGDFELGPDSDFTKVTSFLDYYAGSTFSGASSFSNKGKPLPDWDMSHIYPRGLNFFFKDTLINDDLSHWCVPLHTAAGSVGTGQLGTDPVWGTCNGVESQPIADPFIEIAWEGIVYIGLQEHQLADKDDIKYQRWDLEGPSGSPPTRGNCLFVKINHDEGEGTRYDFKFIQSLSVGMYCRYHNNNMIYKITECGDGSEWYTGYGATTMHYIQLSGFDGYEDPDFFAQWNTRPEASSKNWSSIRQLWFDAWRDTNPFKE